MAATPTASCVQRYASLTRAAAGAYRFQVTASSGGQAVAATPLMRGQVASVTLGADGAHAIVPGIGDVPVRQINRIM